MKFITLIACLLLFCSAFAADQGSSPLPTMKGHRLILYGQNDASMGLIDFDSIHLDDKDINQIDFNSVTVFNDLGPQGSSLLIGRIGINCVTKKYVVYENFLIDPDGKLIKDLPGTKGLQDIPQDGDAVITEMEELVCHHKNQSDPETSV